MRARVEVRVTTHFLHPLPMWLRRAHVSEPPTLYHVSEAVPASSHGNGTGRTLGSVTCPAAEAGNDPREPGDGELGMRVLLLGRLALEPGLQGLEHRQLIRCNHIGGRAIDRTVTGKTSCMTIA